MASALNLADLGRRVRTARLARRLTLDDVVSRAEFTVSWLSKVENGLLTPSLEGLVRLAEVLECGVDQFVVGLSVTPKLVVDRRDQGRMASGREGPKVEHLATAWPNRAMEPAIIEVAGAGTRETPMNLSGQRFFHVLEGRLRLTYGDERIVLAAGDSVYLDASLPHSLAATGRRSARVLSVLFEPTRNGHLAGGGGPWQPRPAEADGQAAAAPV